MKIGPASEGGDLMTDSGHGAIVLENRGKWHSIDWAVTAGRLSVTAGGPLSPWGILKALR